jgi:HK97 family phage prohead protease
MDLLKRVFESEIKGIDEKEMTLTAYISTNARDRMDEVLEPAGMDKKNFNKNPVVLWAHQYDQPPIGKALWTKEDDVGILSKVKFAPTPFAQEIFQLYKEGFLKAFSVGFVPKDYEDGDGQKKAKRTYKKWELLEYSAVPVPANPEALSLAIQRGILKDESLKKSFEIVEPKVEKIKEEQPEYTKAGLDELMADNSLLTERIVALEKENSDLRYKLYSVTQTQQPVPPEIAVDDIAQQTVKIIDGVIRKAQGKLN